MSATDDEIALRPYTEADLPVLTRLLGDPAMTQHIGGPESPEQISRRHARYLKMNGADKGRIYIVTLGPEHTDAGSVIYWESEHDGQPIWEMGWSTLPAFQGCGVASRGVTALLELIRKQDGPRYVHAFPSVENGPSNGVCRKTGFALMGEITGEYPVGHFMQVNDWRYDLQADPTA